MFTDVIEAKPELIKVYRVEHKVNRQGPYTNKRSRKWLRVSADMASRHSRCPCHPSPEYDGLHTFEGWSDQQCGFVTLADLVRWFQDPVCGDWIEPLIEHGYQVGIYHVPGDKVGIGRNQCVFPLEFSKRVTAMPLRKVCKEQETVK